MPKTCAEKDCKTRPSFNIKNKPALYCTIHKTPEMINVVSPTCKEKGCKKQPCYNIIWEKPLYCFDHKTDEMIDVKHKRCITKGCDLLPCFNVIGEKALYCDEHKTPEMIDVCHKTCAEKDCKTRSNYNFKGKKALYCKEHIKPEMIDVCHKPCDYNGCKTLPIFNYDGETHALYCRIHKKDNMIDVINKKCIHDGCTKQPCYNMPGATYPEYCFDHKINDEMVNVKSNKCKGELCNTIVQDIQLDNYKGYCVYCFQHLFPNDPMCFKIRSKTKEIAVRDYINSVFDGFQHDKPLWTGNCDCTHRRRIDHHKLIGNTLLCIETDEHQHKHYDDTDEEIRYDDLFMIHGGKFIYIRFNPDKYKNKNGTSDNPVLNTRLPVLMSEIEKQIKRIENDENTELVEIIKLYYDENNF